MQRSQKEINLMSGMSDFLDFRGRVVLITGAATDIGRAVAVAFAAHGAKLSIGDVNEEADARRSSS
jgi:NAD(P)-dependent dehydrogenase (short-subunit alcohol dehydrogenase family)